MTVWFLHLHFQRQLVTHLWDSGRFCVVNCFGSQLSHSRLSVVLICDSPPTKFHTLEPISSISERDLIRKQGLCSDEVMRVGPNPRWLVSLFKGEICTQRQAHWENKMWRGRQGLGHASTSLKTPKLPENHRKLGDREEIIFDSSQKEGTLSTPWSWTSGLQNCMEINLCRVSHPVHGTLL